MPASVLLLLTALLQPLERVLTDCLEQGVARLTVDVLLPEQALLDERRERVEVGVADRLGRLERAATREDREPGEQGLLLHAEQAMAPVDRCPQRPLAGGRVAASLREQRETLAESLAELLGRQRPDSRGRKLDRERQAVEPLTDLGDGSPVLLGDHELIFRCLRAHGE